MVTFGQLTRNWTSTVVANGLTALGNVGSWKTAPAIGVLLVAAAQAHAKAPLGFTEAAGDAGPVMVAGVLECVPYARSTSGIQLFGDAHTWWSQAQGKYARGRSPQPGAVMAIQPHGGSILGHVATVTRVLGARKILISHANWSAPGKIERNVSAVDVSPTNDWSQVRVWFAPIQNLGGAHWPVAGFIYNAKPGKVQNAKLDKPVGSRSALTKFVAPRITEVRTSDEQSLPFGRKTSARAKAAKASPKRIAQARARKDPIGAILNGTY